MNNGTGDYYDKTKKVVLVTSVGAGVVSAGIAKMAVGTPYALAIGTAVGYMVYHSTAVQIAVLNRVDPLPVHDPDAAEVPASEYVPPVHQHPPDDTTYLRTHHVFRGFGK